MKNPMMSLNRRGPIFLHLCLNMSLLNFLAEMCYDIIFNLQLKSTIEASLYFCETTNISFCSVGSFFSRILCVFKIVLGQVK